MLDIPIFSFPLWTAYIVRHRCKGATYIAPFHFAYIRAPCTGLFKKKDHLFFSLRDDQPPFDRWRHPDVNPKAWHEC